MRGQELCRDGPSSLPPWRDRRGGSYLPEESRLVHIQKACKQDTIAVKDSTQPLHTKLVEIRGNKVRERATRYRWNTAARATREQVRVSPPGLDSH